jgi:lipid-A-disaccharide synthase
MRALRRAQPETAFAGVGGPQMEREGLASLFPMSDIAVMGLLPVLARLPSLLARIDETARAIVDDPPDCLVIIDAPDFTHRVARRVRRAAPAIPIVDYVSPTVWAWRPGRARAMRAYVDHVLALLPFEPEAHAALGGPPCDYVGHPLIERLGDLTPTEAELVAREHGPLLVLPGSREAEVRRLMPVYGQTLRLLAKNGPLPEVVIPVAPHMEQVVRARLRGWPLQPRLLSQDEKFASFRGARAALVTSGAATLELALAGVPMVVAYKVSPFEGLLKFLVRVNSMVLANLIIGENVIPEFLQEQATPHALAGAVTPLLSDGPSRKAQRAAFERLRVIILESGGDPSARAAAIVLRYADARRVSAPLV